MMIRKIIPALLVAVFLLLIPSGDLFAADPLLISAECEKSIAGQGDLVRIDITVDRFPDIISFGPVVVKFDPEKAGFYRLAESETLTNFIYTSTQTSDTVTISAVDRLASFGEDVGEDNEINAFHSDEPIVLYSLYFRILPSAKDTADFSVESVDGFINAKQKEVKSTVQSGVTLLVNQSVSQDATLTFLDLVSVSLSPDFDPHITEYEAVVERSVTEIEVRTTSSNIFSAVFINGNRNLVVGENRVTIDVTAQDGQTHMRYAVNVTRKESYLPENAVLMDGDGNLYNFVDPPQEFQAPDGFTQTVRVLNGYSVPTYAKDGLTSVLVYLYDGKNQPAFYFYNADNKTVIPYVEGYSVVTTGRVYTNISDEESLTIPDGFKPFTLHTEEQLIRGFKNSAGDFICFLVDEKGSGGFFQYDQNSGSFYRYVKPDNSRETVYRVLFTLSFIVAVTEAVIIIIIVMLVRKLIADKSSPRPKRV